MDFAKSWKRCDSIMRSLSICPAQAGVIPPAPVFTVVNVNLSRASGGDPKQLQLLKFPYLFVPRKRG